MDSDAEDLDTVSDLGTVDLDLLDSTTSLHIAAVLQKWQHTVVIVCRSMKCRTKRGTIEMTDAPLSPSDQDAAQKHLWDAPAVASNDSVLSVCQIYFFALSLLFNIVLSFDVVFFCSSCFTMS